MANKLRDAVKTGGLECKPLMAYLSDSLLGAADREGVRCDDEGAPRREEHHEYNVEGAQVN